MHSRLQMYFGLRENRGGPYFFVFVINTFDVVELLGILSKRNLMLRPTLNKNAMTKPYAKNQE